MKQYYLEPASEKVQLEIPVKTLRRLMAGKPLLAEDLHCLNQGSQQRVRRLLMDYMMGKS
ncbi:MAG: hypothetical protein GY712_06690 [Oceanicoccus sp.]|uniref:hypothetical protein n=1 Tax=Oceanicoccus sp. TaxID=2691044 RepID=UPI00262A34FC|nr:hypothetical protein [Oceanicoccus sp.]MCP3907687.1 hypothetical protein [Oceanicoccus sp.]MDG1773720.1 hypothetical protein [Oceanicoccus sp.]